jgi:hypothetical protein
MTSQNRPQGLHPEIVDVSGGELQQELLQELLP